MGDTVARLLDVLASKGQKVFIVIDQRAEARAVGLDLRETTLGSYTDPAVIVARHGLNGDVAAPLEGIHGLTDALVSGEGGRPR